MNGTAMYTQIQTILPFTGMLGHSLPLSHAETPHCQHSKTWVLYDLATMNAD